MDHSSENAADQIPTSFPRAPRLDPEAMARAVSVQTGIALTVEGLCDGGEVGAAVVRRPDGHRGVLTWRPHYTVAALASGPLAVVERLRALGYPAPATKLAVQVGDAVVTVQELVPGAKIDRLDLPLLERVLAVHGLQADALAGREDVPAYPLYLREDGPGYCLHEPLRRFSRSTAELERRIAAFGAGHPDRLPGDGAVHGDFHPGNILAADGRITGVVDWDGAARGDHRFDLVVLRFGLHPDHADRAVVERLDALIDALPASVAGPAWAHMSLRMVDWAIRHFPADQVDTWVELARRRID
ncbi:phosphotransferase [Actinospica durhamensis]|uniref:Phosphotransferase n=1 Tax=Actinospica durhamensis TaxID=1508375 RepID=A0A941EPJ3_9ACTN|nr:phosphotransferase [Actinospica durhamensis]MBR7834758.1 phosphotransferase [Actinospica durhamensis]